MWGRHGPRQHMPYFSAISVGGGPQESEAASGHHPRADAKGSVNTGPSESNPDRGKVQLWRQALPPLPSRYPPPTPERAKPASPIIQSNNQIPTPTPPREEEEDAASREGSEEDKEDSASWYLTALPNAPRPPHVSVPRDRLPPGLTRAVGPGEPRHLRCPSLACASPGLCPPRRQCSAIAGPMSSSSQPCEKGRRHPCEKEKEDAASPYFRLSASSGEEGAASRGRG